MMSSKNDTSSSPLYTPLNPTHQNVTVLLTYSPHHHHRRRRNYHLLRRCLLTTFLLLLLTAAVYILYPYDPTIQLTRLGLNRIRIRTTPKLILDLSFSLTVKVHNPDFFSLSYDSLRVAVGYRDRELGIVSSKGGKVKARSSSYVDATLDLDGFEVVHDVFYLIEDLARGVVPFDTITAVHGRLGVFFFHIPIKGRVSCEVYVNVHNQTVVRQDCYPE